MKAAFYAGPYSIQLGECVPALPAAGEVQLRVSYCGICGTDLHIFHGSLDHRVKTLTILGHEIAGSIEALGKGIDGWSVGDPVTVFPLVSCGHCSACKEGHPQLCPALNFLGIDSPGAFQSLWTVPAQNLFRLPPDLSLTRGALVEPLAVACHSLRLGNVQAEENVVVIGAGPIGMLLALVAKHAGAHVLLSEINPFRLQLAAKLGLETVDPKQTDLVERVNEKTGGLGVDAVFEASGTQAGAQIMTQLPRPHGRIVVVGVYSLYPPVDLSRFIWRELQMCGARAYSHQDFQQAINLAACQTMPLDGLITDVVGLDGLEAGLRRMDSGGPCMKILIDCQR